MAGISTRELATQILQQMGQRKMVDPNEVIRKCYPHANELIEPLPHGAKTKLSQWIKREICLDEVCSARTIANWINGDGTINPPQLLKPAFAHFYAREHIELNK